MRIFLAALLCLSLRCAAETVPESEADCAPATLTTLSRLAGQPVPYEVWRHDLMPGGVPQDVLAMLVSWFLRESWLDLEPVAPDRYEITPFQPRLGVPYLLVCTMPISDAVFMPDLNCHLCVARFAADHVTLINTLYSADDKQSYLLERVTYQEYARRLVYLFEIVPASPLVLRWKNLDD